MLLVFFAGGFGMHNTNISIWFFNGVLLTIYGCLIGGYGVYEITSGQIPPVALAYLHAPVWWGGGLLVLGLFYCVKFAPSKQITQQNKAGKQ
jgi:hypothetical protein